MWRTACLRVGLQRSGKSCRLRWLNHLRPNLKHGHISIEEERIILELHDLWGNKLGSFLLFVTLRSDLSFVRNFLTNCQYRWSRIARMLPGRTDNGIKNYWRTRLKKKAQLAQEEGAMHLFCSLMILLG